MSCTTPTPPPAAPDLAQIKTDIQAMEDAFAAALNTKTTDAIAAYYADDAVHMPMDMAPKVG